MIGFYWFITSIVMGVRVLLDHLLIPWMREYWIGHSLFANVTGRDHVGRLAECDGTIDVQGGGSLAACGNGDLRHKGDAFLNQGISQGDRGVIPPPPGVSGTLQSAGPLAKSRQTTVAGPFMTGTDSSRDLRRSSRAARLHSQTFCGRFRHNSVLLRPSINPLGPVADLSSDCWPLKSLYEEPLGTYQT